MCSCDLISELKTYTLQSEPVSDRIWKSHPAPPVFLGRRLAFILFVSKLCNLQVIRPLILCTTWIAATAVIDAAKAIGKKPDKKGKKISSQAEPEVG